MDIVSPQPADPLKTAYVVVDLTPDVVAYVSANSAPSFRGRFRGAQSAPTRLIGVGDIVSVTLFEAAAGGLFIPNDAGARPGNFVQLPPQEVDRNGNINVPYAGVIPAAGRTLPEIQETIEARLRNRAIEPQAVVVLQDARSNQVTVTGEVNGSTRFALSAAGERIVDAISRAGGPRHPGYETLVTLQRRGQQGTVSFNRLISEPENNIYLQPGDTVVLSREAKSFLAFGASGQNGQINFEADDITLAQAVAKAGGILDERGDPQSVFIYRMEPKKLVAQMGYDVAGFITPSVPVIYRSISASRPVTSWPPSSRCGTGTCSTSLTPRRSNS
jgi:polysaccharide export outer membrane protein